MRRYKMDVVVRSENPNDCDKSEKVLKCNITAKQEFLARRAAIERAWSNGFLVSRFMSVQ